jgi:hypothetical protein
MKNQKKRLYATGEEVGGGSGGGWWGILLLSLQATNKCNFFLIV